MLGLLVLGYGVTYVWPSYDWDVRVPSPGGQYDLVVLRGDAAAFADVSWHLYVFPHELTPRDRAKGDRVVFAAPWRDSTYLVYSGFNYPQFRWTGEHSVEVLLHEVNYSPAEFHPVKTFSSGANVLISLGFGEPRAGGARYESP